MNSNFSVTDGRGRSTPRLFSGSRSPSSVPGFPVRARAAAPAHSRSAAALRRHAHGGKRPPSYRGYPRLYRAPSPLWRSGATSRSPSSRLHPGIQERSSSSVEAITYLSRRPHYIGGTVRKPRGSSGEQGVGKSSLLRAGLGEAEGQECRVLWGAGGKMGQRIPLWLMGEVF